MALNTYIPVGWKKYCHAITLKHTNSVQPGKTSVQSVYTLGTHNVQSTFKAEIAPLKPILPIKRNTTERKLHSIQLPSSIKAINSKTPVKTVFCLCINYQVNPVLSRLVTGL